MADCVLSLIEKIARPLIHPIARQFGYLIDYNNNIKSLRDQVDLLEERRATVQQLVEVAKRQGEEILHDVEGWTGRVGKSSGEANRILEQDKTAEANKRCLNGWWWCPTLMSRYSHSRKAKKMVPDLVGLYDGGSFTRVSCPAARPGIEARTIDGIKIFESRSSVLKEVVEALKDDGASNMVGICGMGGVGKTTLVKQVAKKAKEDKLFDHVLMTTVSQNPEAKKIQGEIGDQLGFKFKDETDSGRADSLREQLKQKKRILIILDDVWEILDLNEIGISFGNSNKGCKFLVTSRSEEVCNDMGAKINVKVAVLSSEEAWNLFSEMAEISEDDSDLSTKKAVANECGCLPLAIVTVGRALKGKDERSWRSALAQLHKSVGEDIRGVEENVFRVLELSYNYLSEEAKKCLLLCSIFREDSDIKEEDIVRYGIGLKLFKKIDSVGEARDRVHSHMDHLKKCFLLMDGTRDGCVKMHDVMRDVAISIASRKEHPFMVKSDDELKEWPENGNYAVISMRCTHMGKELPHNLEFPNLQLLWLEGTQSRFAYFSTEVPEGLFLGMKELKVLALSRLKIQSPPTSLRCLTNLQTLSLVNCELNDMDLKVIGALNNLEILVLNGSRDIMELPKEIGNLTRLKLLDLLSCRVSMIPHGVLSGLSKLEELYLGPGFTEWDVVEEREDTRVTNASVAELASLPNLMALDIYVPNTTSWVLPRNVAFLGKLRTFNVRLGQSRKNELLKEDQDICVTSACRLVLTELDISHGAMEIRGLKMLLKITTYLILESIIGARQSIGDLDEDGFKHLSDLIVYKSSDVECLIDTSNGQQGKDAFCALKTLYLHDLPGLKHLCRGPTQHPCFRNLTEVILLRCPELEYVFPLAVARNLVQLKKIAVRDCSRVKAIFASGGGAHEIEADEDDIVFPVLETLNLFDLPEFTFCKAGNAIRLPQLKKLVYGGTPKINCLFPASRNNYDTTIQPLFNNKDTLSTLETVTIQQMDELKEIWPGDLQANVRTFEVEDCGKLSTILFPSNLIQCMQKLEQLEVISCGSVEVAFDLSELNNIGGEGNATTAIPFPCLEDLSLRHLDHLRQVWASYSPRISQGFQNLRELHLFGCPRLRTLMSPFVARLLVNLQELTIRRCKAMEEMIEWEEGEVDDRVTTDVILFPQLTSLGLGGLPILRSFCPLGCTFQGSFLFLVMIEDCPALELESLPPAVQRLINQQRDQVDSSRSEKMVDSSEDDVDSED